MYSNRQNVVAFLLATAGAVFVAGLSPTAIQPTARMPDRLNNATAALTTTKSDTSTAEPTTRVTLSRIVNTKTVVSNTTKTVSLFARRAECLQKTNLTQQLPTNFTCSSSLLVHHSLADFWTHHASPYMCQNREAHEDLVECTLNATKECLPRKNRLHFPDNAKVRRSLHYLCDISEARPAEVNITCGQSLFPEVFQCLYQDTQLALGRSSLLGHIDSQLICRTYDIAVYCCWETLQACGAVTAGAYTRIMALYLRPPSCPNSAVSALTPPLTLLLLLGLGLVLGRCG